MINLSKTEKLYYEDRYLKEFKANAINVVEKNGDFHVALDKTTFFPGGGGQPCDTGVIEGIEVKEVYEEDGVIFHVLETNLKRKEKLKCTINWERRLDGMQQHLAQHVLSGCFYEYFNSNTVGFHLGNEISTVDIIGFLEEDKIHEAEKLANDAIIKGLVVDSFSPSKQELKKLKLRRDLPKTNEEIRVVKIEDLDINACCGIHPRNTIELQLIKIKRWEKNKGNTRIEYVAGKRAIEDLFNKEKIVREISSILNAGEDSIVNTVNNIINGSRNLNEENKKLKNELSSYQIKELIDSGESLGDINVIKKVYNGEDAKHLSKLASKLIEEDNRIILFASINEDKVSVIFTSSKNIKKVSMNDLLKDAITLVDGKGGGNANLAQGAGKGINNVDNALDYALRRLRDNL
ncbi:alanyl-tRNA editing protein [Clostridium cylindrosporum]|uniref:Alanine--tRNA ligase n=1 Tax=Clostridium cylindrosporum DSM 605 TaxID=1121307 RepID=A0A0J8DDE0_CLOCY|nr:DHHA1 domain-containing protein [Clostridium cylindrosporum]KMT22254.1 alanyl-tRNA editing protein AlaXL [Clostridium cylindrosporum DSM 605]